VFVRRSDECVRVLSGRTFRFSEWRLTGYERAALQQNDRGGRSQTNVVKTGCAVQLLRGNRERGSLGRI